jgi:uncharacterized protein (DUF1778 family)
MLYKRYQLLSASKACILPANANIRVKMAALKREKVIMLRLTQKEKNLLERAAKRALRKTSDYVRVVALERAELDLAEDRQR